MTNTVKKQQYGLWESPITPLSLSREMKLRGLSSDQDGTLVWLEGRSDRGVLVVQKPDGQAARDLNSELSVQAKVGYGGGDFAIQGGKVFFVHAESGRIYQQPIDFGQARVVTPAFGQSASPTPSPDGKWLVYVHSYENRDCLAIIDAEGNYWPQKLVEGEDFYMQPAWHPDTKRLAWIAWNHPNMPWDGTYLRMGELEKGQRLPRLAQVDTLVGGEDVSVFQPQFSPDGRYLAYISDLDGWWQLYWYDLQNGEHRQLTHEPAEHGQPAWVQGMRTYTFSLDGQSIYFLRNRQGFVSLWQLALPSGDERCLTTPEPYTALDQICAVPGGVGLIASAGDIPGRVITVTFQANIEASTQKIQRRSTSEELPGSSYAVPQAITWSGMDNQTVYGLFYAPRNERFSSAGLPPLIMRIHGGPTSQTMASFNTQVQFFTSRGYALLDVNYRGSTGYGRAYRNQLRGNWGICDVQDAVSGAKYLIQQGLVDENKIVIMGGSAGGFTVLKALEDFPAFFKAGICLFGVSNQFTLAAETHKFEAHYSDQLLGPLPDAAPIYRERSPIFFVDKIKDPVAIFQGEIDVVVPRKQSDEVASSLQRRGVPHIYHVYPGEGHGFRKAETIDHFYRAVEQFLRQYVIFD